LQQHCFFAIFRDDAEVDVVDDDAVNAVLRRVRVVRSLQGFCCVVVVVVVVDCSSSVRSRQVQAFCCRCRRCCALLLLLLPAAATKTRWRHSMLVAQLRSTAVLRAVFVVRSTVWQYVLALYIVSNDWKTDMYDTTIINYTPSSRYPKQRKRRYYQTSHRIDWRRLIQYRVVSFFFWLNKC